MIIEEYDESLFIQRFENMNRVVNDKNPNGNFSYKGLRYLFEYLDDLYTEEEPLKLDVISLCCDYSEYKNLEEYLNDYPTDLKRDDYDSDEEYFEAIEEKINENTTLIKFEDDINEGFIISQY